MTTNNITLLSNVSIVGNGYYGEEYLYLNDSSYNNNESKQIKGIEVSYFVKENRDTLSEYDSKEDLMYYYFNDEIRMLPAPSMLYSYERSRELNCHRTGGYFEYVHDSINSQLSEMLNNWCYIWGKDGSEGADTSVLYSNYYFYSLTNTLRFKDPIYENLSKNRPVFEYYLYKPEQIEFTFENRKYTVTSYENAILPMGNILLNEEQKKSLDSFCHNKEEYECLLDFLKSQELMKNVEWFYNKAKPALLNYSPQDLMEIYIDDPDHDALQYSVLEVNDAKLIDYLNNAVTSKLFDFPESSLKDLPHKVRNAIRNQDEHIEVLLPDYVLFEIFLDNNLIFKLLKE